jgi:hypothetical protein
LKKEKQKMKKLILALMVLLCVVMIAPQAFAASDSMAAGGVFAFSAAMGSVQEIDHGIQQVSVNTHNLLPYGPYLLNGINASRLVFGKQLDISFKTDLDGSGNPIFGPGVASADAVYAVGVAKSCGIGGGAQAAGSGIAGTVQGMFAIIAGGGN